MDPLLKLAWARDAAQFEADEWSTGQLPNPIKTERRGYTEKQLRERYAHMGPEPSIPAKGEQIPIFMAAGGGGRRVPLLKSMLTTACERNCNYCAFRAPRNYRRITFKPEELAATFFKAHQAGWVDGLFLSTGICSGGMMSQDKLIETASLLRTKHHYHGYIHLKIMPGAEYDQVRRSMQLANRVSANLEAPNQVRLTHLAPQKQFQSELLQPLLWAEEIRRSDEAKSSPWSNSWASSSTQFVVGPAGESDLELLGVVACLFRHANLHRAYFEAFNPIQETPFEDEKPENPARQNRLYQASYLLRDYGFDLEELPFQPDGNLPQGCDPKQAYAELHYKHAPLEINRAPREMLLRIPGIGTQAARAILRTRREQRLKDLGQLRAIGIQIDRTAPYILLDGRRPPYQTKLFPL